MLDETFLQYSALDSACTLQCRNAFWHELSNGYRAAYDLTIDSFEPLMFMQTRGIKVDLDALAATKISILKTRDEKQEALNEICGRELNVNSPKDCQTYFYVELGRQPYLTKQGKITIDDTALQRLARGTVRHEGLQSAKLVQEIRGLNKLFGTYLNIEFDADNRIRCSYNPRGTKFGRLSSSKTIFGTGTNLQNLPQEFKKFLVADPGYVFWEVDKRQAEWVVVAYLTGDANMLSVVESGKDTHVHTASLMFNAPEELIVADDTLVGHESNPDTIRQIRADAGIEEFTENFPRTMSARQCGKKSNHGLNYDEGPNTFALINEIPPAESKRIIAMYHHIYPGIRIWYGWIKRQLQTDRTLTNCFGRRVRFMDAWGNDLWKSAYSMLPSSTVVDSLNIGMKGIYDDPHLCHIEGVNIDILAQVHDSILLQLPIEVALDSKRFLAVQERVYDYVSPELEYNNRKFKIATDSKFGLNWSGYHPERNPAGMREIKDLTTLPKLVREFCGQNT